MRLFFEERILYWKFIATMQLQLYRTVNDGKECQERDFLWPYDKVDIEKKWDFSLRERICSLADGMIERVRENVKVRNGDL